MKLRFTPRATANLIEIADDIHAHNPAAAERVRAAIYESLQNLILFPHVGRLQKAESVRKYAQDTLREYLLRLLGYKGDFWTYSIEGSTHKAID
jgi:plasmid stabilization system protein ParE